MPSSTSSTAWQVWCWIIKEMSGYIMYFGVVWINLITLLAEINSETLVFLFLHWSPKQRNWFWFCHSSYSINFSQDSSTMFTSVYDNLHVGFLRSSFVNAVWLKLSMWRFWSIMMEKSDFTSNLTPMYSKICFLFWNNPKGLI